MDAARDLKVNLKLVDKPCLGCRVPLKLGDDAAVCTACDGGHHKRCWDAYGGCATKGCANAPLKRLDPIVYGGPPVPGFKAKAAGAAATAVEVEPAAEAAERPTTRCSICYTVVRATETPVRCPDCQTDYHKSCWDEIGGCGSYGCKKAAVAHKPPIPVLVGAGWGDAKECPSCGTHIASSTLRCHCGAQFPWADPMTRSEYQAWLTGQEQIKHSRTALIWMFIFSLIGFTAPVVGPIAGFYAHRKRALLAGTGGTYLAMGYASAAIGGFYTLLVVLLAAGL